METASKVRVVGIVGSIRRDSLNRKLAQAFAAALGGAGAEVELLDVGHLPLFDQDLEASFPEAAAAFGEKIRAADAAFVATPEYNRSIPGVLKNAIDWSSRPYGSAAWRGKPVAVLGATMGGLGTVAAQTHLKSILAYLDARVVGQPEFYLGAAHEKFDGSGALADEKARELLATLAAKLVAEARR